MISAPAASPELEANVTERLKVMGLAKLIVPPRVEKVEMLVLKLCAPLPVAVKAPKAVVAPTLLLYVTAPPLVLILRPCTPAEVALIVLEKEMAPPAVVRVELAVKTTRPVNVKGPLFVVMLAPRLIVPPLPLPATKVRPAPLTVMVISLEMVIELPTAFWLQMVTVEPASVNAEGSMLTEAALLQLGD